MVWTSSLRPLRLGEEKKKDGRRKHGAKYKQGGHKEQTTWQKYDGLPYSIGWP